MCQPGLSCAFIPGFHVVDVALDILLVLNNERDVQKECMVLARAGVLEVFQVFVLIANERSQRNQFLWVIAFECFVTNVRVLACL